MLIFSLIVLALIGLGIYWFAKESTSSIHIDLDDISPLDDIPSIPTANEETLKKSQSDTLAEAKASKVKTDAILAKANETLAKADAVLADSTSETKPKKKRRYYKPKAKK